MSELDFYMLKQEFLDIMTEDVTRYLKTGRVGRFLHYDSFHSLKEPKMRSKKVKRLKTRKYGQMAWRGVM